MGIFSRLNTVIKSNLNSLVDKAEDPDKLIGQTVEDMKAEVKRARRELVTTLGTAKRLAKKVDELEDEVEGWEEKAVLAVKSGDDALAREALRRKAKLKTEIEATRGRANQQASSADEMKDTLDKIEEKIEDLKARRSTLAAQVRKARESDDPSTGRYGSSSFDELERMSQRIDQLDSEVEAGALLEDPKRADVDARFRKLERNMEGGAVDDELAALKRRLES
ncbi:MAG: PspA/IM30 family protein [Deltaproteobacteria bacterium]|nr:PspA/IM30 family protein [Deltaproteobacteria bacterium]